MPHSCVPANIAWLLGTLLDRRGRVQLTGRGEFSQQFAHSLDFWWMYLFHMRALSAAAVGGVVLGFAATLGAVLMALLRSVRLCDSWIREPKNAVLPQVPLQ